MHFLTNLLVSSMLCSNLAWAQPLKEIPCPQISSIQNAASKLDSIGDFNGLTYVWTSSPAITENNHNWSIATLFKKGSISENEIIPFAQEQVRGINSLEEPNAEEDTLYVCYYGPANVVALTGQVELTPQFFDLYRR